jgi:hypothetical protein
MNVPIKVIIFFLIFQNNAYAYLDPGTGSSILQLILAAVAGIGSLMGFYWRKTVIFFKNIKKKFNKNNKDLNQQKKG